jgi:hypothetical protein
MRVQVSTKLDCASQQVWREVQTSRLLEHISAPLLTFEPLDPPVLPTVWEKRRYVVRMKLFGMLPLGRQAIEISTPLIDYTSGRQMYQIRDNGYGDLIATWDHLISICEAADGRTHYTDRIDIRAGVLTPLIWLFAQVLYRHRQRRWRRLVGTNFAYGTPSITTTQGKSHS